MCAMPTPSAIMRERDSCEGHGVQAPSRVPAAGSLSLNSALNQNPTNRAGRPWANCGSHDPSDAPATSREARLGRGRPLRAAVGFDERAHRRNSVRALSPLRFFGSDRSFGAALSLTFFRLIRYCLCSCSHPGTMKLHGARYRRGHLAEWGAAMRLTYAVNKSRFCLFAVISLLAGISGKALAQSPGCDFLTPAYTISQLNVGQMSPLVGTDQGKFFYAGDVIVFGWSPNITMTNTIINETTGATVFNMNNSSGGQNVTISINDYYAMQMTNDGPDPDYNVTIGCQPRDLPHDNNADGRSDIQWRNSSGDTSIWFMNGTTVLSTLGLGAISTTFQIVGQRDFNGDGNYDFLWRDSSGNTSIWFLSGTGVTSTASLGNIPTTWSVVGTGDFNADGKGDILWQDSSGNLAVWLMNGGTVASSGGIGNVPSPWQVVGIGDFSGTGYSDILWRDNSGDTSIWFMDGTSVSFTQSLGNIPTNWSIAGTGDFNGDGMTDILWRDSSGDTSVWLMNGASVLSSGSLGNIPTNWSVVQIGDYNGDGKNDILWRDNLGNTSIWFMNGAAVASTGSLGNIPTTWTVQSVNAE
jgi:hypothetical protein